MTDSRNPHTGIEALLTSQNSALLLIDHQASQLANLRSHEPTLIVMRARSASTIAIRKTSIACVANPWRKRCNRR